MNCSADRRRIWLSLWAGWMFVLLFVAGAPKPLNLDSTEFPMAVEATARTGKPVYYHSEQNPSAVGLYHPPLYIYSMAAWVRVFGFGEIQLRLFGMTCAILQGAVVLAIIRTLFGRDRMRRWRPWFWIIFLLNPYTIQGASITDIDSTVYGPLLCMALLAVLRLSWRDGERRTDSIGAGEYGLAGAALFLCLWAKLTTVLLVFPFVFLLLVARTGARRAAGATAALAGGSIAAFAVSYWIYGLVAGLDVSFTYAFTWMSFTHRGSSGAGGLIAGLSDRARNFAGMVPFMFRWIGLAPWMFAATAVAVAFTRFWRSRDRRALDYGLLILLAFLSTLYYCAQVFTFGYAPFKYVYVYWGLLLTSALYVEEACLRGREFGRWSVAALAALYAGAAAVAMLSVRDTLMYNTGGPVFRAWVILLPAMLLVPGMALLRRRFAGPVVVSALVLYCGLQTGIAISQSRTPYSTTYDYGQTGFEDTAAFLRMNTRPDDLIVSMKDIGFAAKRRFFESYAALTGSSSDVDEIMSLMRSGRAVYAVFTEGRGQDQLILEPRLRDWVLANCRLVASFGNYRIYHFSGKRS